MTNTVKCEPQLRNYFLCHWWRTGARIHLLFQDHFILIQSFQTKIHSASSQLCSLNHWVKSWTRNSFSVFMNLVQHGIPVTYGTRATGSRIQHRKQPVRDVQEATCESLMVPDFHPKPGWPSALRLEEGAWGGDVSFFKSNFHRCSTVNASG